MGRCCLGGRRSRRGWQQNRSFSAEGHRDGWNIACRPGLALKSEDLHYPALVESPSRITLSPSRITLSPSRITLSPSRITLSPSRITFALFNTRTSRHKQLLRSPRSTAQSSTYITLYISPSSLFSPLPPAHTHRCWEPSYSSG
jgi:hypothetical protein